VTNAMQLVQIEQDAEDLVTFFSKQL